MEGTREMIRHILTIPFFLITTLCLPFAVAIAGIGDGLVSYWKAMRTPIKAYRTFYKNLWIY